VGRCGRVEVGGVIGVGYGERDSKGGYFVEEGVGVFERFVELGSGGRRVRREVCFGMGVRGGLVGYCCVCVWVLVFGVVLGGRD
jgi:hypothetical protein